MTHSLLWLSTLCLSWTAISLSDVNVLMITDEDHSPAVQGLDAALLYLRDEALVNITKTARISLIKTEVHQTEAEVCAELDSMNPDLVLDFSRSGKASEKVKSITKNLGLPTVSSAIGGADEILSWSDLSPAQEGYLVQVRSPTDILPFIFRDLANLTSINSAAILYDDTFVMDKHFKNIFVNMPVKHFHLKIDLDTNGSLANSLDHLIKHEKIRNFFIVASGETAKETLQIADLNMLYGVRLAWFVTSLSSNFTTQDCCFDMRLFQLKPRVSVFRSLIDKFGLTQDPLLESVFYADLTYRAIMAVEQMKREEQWPSLEYTKCSSAPANPIIRDINLKAAMAFASVAEDTVSWSSNGGSHFKFAVDVVMSDPGEERKEIGTWTARPPTNQPSLEFLPGQERALDVDVLRSKRKILKVVTKIHPPFVYFNETEGLGYSGYAVDLIQMLSEELGFEYELSMATGGEYGRLPDEGGNWDGMMGDLVNDRADIGLGALQVTAVRELDVDFTVPIYEFVGWGIMMKREPAMRNPFKFYWLQQEAIWELIIIGYFIGLFMVYYVNNLSFFSYRNNMECYVDDTHIRFFGIRELNYYGFSHFTGVGGGIYPKGPTTRFFAIAWWSFAFITCASYAANIGANLTISRMISKRETFQRIQRGRIFDYAPMNDSEPWHYFRQMGDVEAEYYRQYKRISILEEMPEDEKTIWGVFKFPVPNTNTKWFADLEDGVYPLAEDYDDAVFRMVNGTRKQQNYFVFFSDYLDARYLELTWCTVERTGPDEFYKKPFALAIPKHRPRLKAALNAGIMKLQHLKKLERLKHKYWKENPRQPVCEHWTEEGKFDIWHVGGVFLLLPIGVSFAVFWIYVEFFYFKFREWYRDSNIRTRWKKSWFRSIWPHQFIGPTILTREMMKEEEGKQD